MNLAEYGRIRIMAYRLGMETVDREGRLIVIKFRRQAMVDPLRLVKVVYEWPGATPVPPVSVKLDLEAPQRTGSPQPAGSAKGKPFAQPGMRGSRPSLRG